MTNGLTRYAPRPTATRLPDLVDRLVQESFVAPAFFNQFFEGRPRGSMLPANLLETTDSYVVQVALPGITLDALDIQVMGREVTIKGKVEVPAPENGTWIWQGIPGGEFAETFTLPIEVEGDSASATYENGILWLTLPKVEHARPKNIKVNVTK